MQRRTFNQSAASLAALLLGAATRQAWALSLSSLTDKDASSGIKAALQQGAQSAVQMLGQPNGFLNNPKVKIGLPSYLDQASRMLKLIGQGKQIDELVVAMNRAAEAAVPMGKDLLVNAIQTMSVTDAKDILTGGDNAVTTFFATKTRAPLEARFLPVVTQATSQVGLAQIYNRVASKVSQSGVIKPEDAQIERHVTNKTLDGLFLLIGEEEKKIRQDPVAAGSSLLQKVFGALK